MIVRRIDRQFSEGETAAPDVDVRLTQATAMKGLALWVTAGVLTHLAIRTIDSWFDRKKG